MGNSTQTSIQKELDTRAVSDLPDSSVDYMAVTSLEPRLASAVEELWQDKGMQVSAESILENCELGNMISKPITRKGNINQF